MNDQEYIRVEDAANEVGVTKATLYYYIKALKIETKRFPFDRFAYLAISDFEQIKILKEQAAKRGKKSEEAALPHAS